MKLSLNVEERKYLHALTRLIAHSETDNSIKLFWMTLSKELQPNQATCYLRKKQLEMLLAITSQATHNLIQVMKGASDIGQLARGDALEKILNSAKDKLEARLKETE